MSSPFKPIETSHSETPPALTADAILPPPPLKTQVVADAQVPDSSTDWASNNILKPAFNTLIAQPWSAIAFGVNSTSRQLFGSEPVGRIAPMPVNAAGDTAGWLAQNVTTGLGMAVTYALAGRASASVLGSGRGLISSPVTAQIAGAFVYDGMREPHTGETRIGNALAGLTAFTALETGNRWAAGGSMLAGLAKNALVGSVAGSLQVGTSSLISRGELPALQNIESAIVSGGAMNMLLPVMQRSLWRRRPAPVSELSLEPTAASRIDTKNIQLTVGTENTVKALNYEQYLGSNHGLVTAPYKVTQPGVLSKTVVNYPLTKPNYQRIPESDLLAAIDSVPAPSLFKSVTVSDHTHRDQAWLRQVHKDPSATVHGETNGKGEVTLYRPVDRWSTSGTIHHEWWHILRMKNLAEASTFDRLKNIETPVLANPRTEFSKANNAEIWSDLGQVLTGAPLEVATMSAHANPLRSMILGTVLSKALAQVPKEQRGTQFAQAEQMVDFIDKTIRPLAMTKMQELRTTYGIKPLD